MCLEPIRQKGKQLGRHQIPCKCQWQRPQTVRRQRQLLRLCKYRLLILLMRHKSATPLRILDPKRQEPKICRTSQTSISQRSERRYHRNHRRVLLVLDLLVQSRVHLFQIDLRGDASNRPLRSDLRVGDEGIGIWSLKAAGTIGTSREATIFRVIAPVDCFHDIGQAVFGFRNVKLREGPSVGCHYAFSNAATRALSDEISAVASCSAFVKTGIRA